MVDDILLSCFPIYFKAVIGHLNTDYVKITEFEITVKFFSQLKHKKM